MIMKIFHIPFIKPTLKGIIQLLSISHHNSYVFIKITPLQVLTHSLCVCKSYIWVLVNAKITSQHSTFKLYLNCGFYKKIFEKTYLINS